jgi:mRNA-degrading endonuclease RelE of RelBE toxin-antitoxin system
METDRSQIKVIESDESRKDIKKLGKRYRSVKQDVRALISQLEAGEIPGDKVTGNKYPVYKVRVKNSDINKGQSSDYRVIYYIQTPEAILLTNIYSKSDRANISNEEIEGMIEQYMPEIEQQEREVKIESESSDVDRQSERMFASWQRLLEPHAKEAWGG